MPIRLSKYLPYSMLTNKPMFLRDASNAVGVFGFLEKAIAAVYQSYSAVETGSPAEVVRLVTGAPFEVILHKAQNGDAKRFHDKMVQVLASNLKEGN